MRVLVLLLLGVLPLTSALAATALLTQPNAYAVVIGISQYREETIPKVAYAVKDAEAMAQMLEKQAGIPKAHIRLLTDSKATSADLRSLGSWLKMRVTPDSVVYVYYAGHGTPDTKAAESYLVPWDGHPDYPDGLYPLNDLYTTLSQLPAKEVLVMLDSCFSGAAGRSVLATGARPMVLSMESSTLASHKMIVLAAATGNQISSDYDKAGHGLFTHAILTGLQGAADTNKDGLVTVKELYPYVRERVATLAVDELNREQTPVLLPGEQILGARSAMPVAMVIPGTPEVLKKPTTSLSQVQQELKALEAQEKAMEAQGQQVDLQAQVAEKKRQLAEKQRQIDDKQKKLEVASLPTYSAPKENGTKITEAIIKTNFGNIEVVFFRDKAPKHVENFMALAKSGFYNGTIFHRVIPGFMIQGGDPNTKDPNKQETYGQGGPSQRLQSEFNDIPHRRGILSMARTSDPHSAGSQFFIVVKDSNFLDGQYTVFGEVVKGMGVVDKIASLPRNNRDLPNGRAEMMIVVRE